MSIGFRVIRNTVKPPPELILELAECDTSDLSDVMRHSRTMSGLDLRQSLGRRVAGRAVTVSLPLGGVNMLKVAMDQCEEGDVLVVAARGAMSFAMWGGHISYGMRKRGLAGLVVDGAVRDVGEIGDAGLPVFARGSATNACIGDAPGEVNVTVACAGAVVEPGDIIVADENGVVAVPVRDAAEILKKVEALHERHDSWAPDLERGAVPGIEPILASVAEQGCEFVDA
jgi:regulator of RNase E activity RraA